MLPRQGGLIFHCSDGAVAAALADGVPDCATARQLLDIVAEANGYRGKARDGHVNRTINLFATTCAGWLARAGGPPVWQADQRDA